MIFSKWVIPPKLNFEDDEIRKIFIKTLCTYYRLLSPQAGSAVTLSSMINFPYLILSINFILLLRASGVTFFFYLTLGVCHIACTLFLHLHTLHTCMLAVQVLCSLRNYPAADLLNMSGHCISQLF